MTLPLLLFHNQGKGIPIGKDEIYINRILNIRPNNLLAGWVLNEVSGTIADNVEGTAARDGTYARDVSVMGIGAGIGDGNTAPIFDGTNDYVNIYSASLNSAFNGSEGTATIWSMVSGSGIWTDGLLHLMFRLRVNDTNFVQIFKRVSPNNQVSTQYAAGGTVETITDTLVTDLTWMNWTVTWSKSNDRVILYKNGSPVGSPSTSLGNWSGNLAATTTVIGAWSTTPQYPWSGRLAHNWVWSAELTPEEISEIVL